MRVSISLVFAITVILSAEPMLAQTSIDSHYAGSDSPSIDGHLDEWFDETGQELAIFMDLGENDRVSGGEEWFGNEDASAEFAVAHNAKGLFMACKIKDQRFIRTPRLVKGEDHLELWFGLEKKGGRGDVDTFGFGVYADPSKHRAPVEIRMIKPGARKAGKKVRHAQGGCRGEEQDYAVEIGIPWSAFPRIVGRRSTLRMALYLVDGDMASKLAEKTILGTSPISGRGSADNIPLLGQTGQDSSFDAFYETVGLSPNKSPYFVTSANLLGARDHEELVFVDNYVMVHGEGVGAENAFIYHQLPITEPSQLTKKMFVDLTGDRRPEIILEYVEDNATNTRRWFEIYQITPDRVFKRMFSAALLVSNNLVTIENQYRIVRGKGKTKALEIKAYRAKGIEAGDSVDYVPEEGGNTMVLPWDKPSKVKYMVQGDQFIGK
jgi:hypothetical protein